MKSRPASSALRPSGVPISNDALVDCLCARRGHKQSTSASITEQAAPFRDRLLSMPPLSYLSRNFASHQHLRWQMLNHPLGEHIFVVTLAGM